MKKLIILSLVLFLSGCVVKNEVDKNAYLDLKSRDFKQDLLSNLSLKKSQNELKILKISSKINTKSIIYEKDSLNYEYAYHFWADLPANLLYKIVLNKTLESGVFRAVVPYNSQGSASLKLELNLNEFKQVLSKDSNEVKISFLASLIKENKIIAQKNFTQITKLEQSSINSLLEGFELAVNLSVDELILWLSLNAN